MAQHGLSFVAFSPLAQARLLDKFDPGNPPQFPIPLGPLLPPGPEGRALAAGLDRRQRHDLAMERLAGPLKRPYRAVRAE